LTAGSGQNASDGAIVGTSFLLLGGTVAVLGAGLIPLASGQRAGLRDDGLKLSLAPGPQGSLFGSGLALRF
jgi:hypothetical protein